jgi:hypothetical protein
MIIKIIYILKISFVIYKRNWALLWIYKYLWNIYNSIIINNYQKKIFYSNNNNIALFKTTYNQIFK